MGKREEAEDLVQESLAAFWESIRRKKPPVATQIWWFSIARNLWHQHCRQCNAQPQPEHHALDTIPAAIRFLSVRFNWRDPVPKMMPLRQPAPVEVKPDRWREALNPHRKSLNHPPRVPDTRFWILLRPPDRDALPVENSAYPS